MVKLRFAYFTYVPNLQEIRMRSSQFTNEEISRAMLHICHSDTPMEAWLRYEQAEDVLHHCKFVFASDDERAPTPGRAIRRDFSATGAVRTLFSSRNIVVIDRETSSEMRRGGSTFVIDYSISLDTNALSYLLPFLDSKTTRLPADFGEVFTFIADPCTNVDSIPYRMENLQNLTSCPKADNSIYLRLRAYEILRTLDPASVANGKPHSYLTDAELEKCAQEQMASLYESKNDARLMENIRLNHEAMYCLLLKMCLIQLKRPNMSTKNKILQFLEFCDIDLATIYSREIMLARHYFVRGQDMNFFKKIMIGGRDPLENLRNMAWDLWHVRQLEISTTIRPIAGARYFIPALLTFDKGLIEVIDLCPFRAIAYDERFREPHIVYRGEWLSDIAGGDEATCAALEERFFSEKARALRELNRASRRSCLSKLINSLEREMTMVVTL